MWRHSVTYDATKHHFCHHDPWVYQPCNRVTESHWHLPAEKHYLGTMTFSGLRNIFWKVLTLGSNLPTSRLLCSFNQIVWQLVWVYSYWLQDFLDPDTQCLWTTVVRCFPVEHVNCCDYCKHLSKSRVVDIVFAQQCLLCCCIKYSIFPSRESSANHNFWKQYFPNVVICADCSSELFLWSVEIQTCKPSSSMASVTTEQIQCSCCSTLLQEV